ncbi:MAG: hypothetical protein KAY22_20770 [Rhizorhabdus sp.]|jgi:hypothetical protein|nr:hypothetical protein [Rhizorhabdus sp.]MBP8234730.1 hypothetical protein [Rhizorhabdus sp.]
MYFKTQKDVNTHNYRTQPQRQRLSPLPGASLSRADLKRLVADMVD